MNAKGNSTETLFIPLKRQHQCISGSHRKSCDIHSPTAGSASAQTGLTVLHLAAVQGNLQTVQHPGSRAAHSAMALRGMKGPMIWEMSPHEMLQMRYVYIYTYCISYLLFFGWKSENLVFLNIMKTTCFFLKTWFFINPQNLSVFQASTRRYITPYMDQYELLYSSS